MKVSPARRAAFEILRRVEDEGAYSSVLLAAIGDGLSAKDRSLCHELVLGVLRNRLWLDRAIEHFGSRKIEKLDLPVTLAFRLGLYQLCFLTRIPPSAAVNESVNLVRASRLKSAAAFVNAVLRRATRASDYDPSADVDDDLEKLAIETSHPHWLVERWSSQFGFDEAAALARTNNQPAPPAFRFTARALRSGAPRALIEELEAAGVHLIESKIAPGAWRFSRLSRAHENTGRDAGGPHARMRALQSDGLIYFQDEASQLVAHLVGAREFDRVLDVCAAPGSKSTLIAALAPDALVVSGDLYEPRAQLVRAFAHNQHASNISVIQHDATRELPFPSQSFDRVLVDAPCSGTGTLRHNPEIRWRLRESDIAELAAKQKQILQNAAAVVKAGGRLVYSTCSVERGENEAIVAEFLKDKAFERAKLEAPGNLLTAQGAVRTWPQRDDVEGFFVTAFRRIC